MVDKISHTYYVSKSKFKGIGIIKEIRPMGYFRGANVLSLPDEYEFQPTSQSVGLTLTS